MTEQMSANPSRFLDLDGVAAELATTKAQAYALVRQKKLLAIKIGGRGLWRVERSKLEEFIARAYDDTSRWIDENPFGSDIDPEPNV